MVSDYVENIANMKVDPLEIISTEDLLSRVNDHNQKVAEVDPDTKPVLGGCDAVALFPSMTSRKTGRAVREATINIIKESGLKIEGLDYTEIVMNMRDFEIQARKLNKISPQRKFTRGHHPTMSGKGSLQKK